MWDVTHPRRAQEMHMQNVLFCASLLRYSPERPPFATNGELKDYEYLLICSIIIL